MARACKIKSARSMKSYLAANLMQPQRRRKTFLPALQAKTFASVGVESGILSVSRPLPGCPDILCANSSCRTPAKRVKCAAAWLGLRAGAALMDSNINGASQGYQATMHNLLISSIFFRLLVHSMFRTFHPAIITHKLLVRKRVFGIR